MRCWQLVLATMDRNPLAFSERVRRQIVHKIARVAGRETVAFCVVDDHTHTTVLCSRQRASLLSRALTLALRPLAPDIAPREPRPVNGRRHLLALVRYILTQVWHHDIAGADPALWSGSCFQDIVGARILPGLELKLGAALPRYQLGQAFSAVGLPNSHDLSRPQPTTIRQAGVARLVEAAESALCVGPRLAGNSTPVVRARRAVAQLAAKLHLRAGEVAEALRVSAAAVRRLASQDLDFDAQRALLRRLALEDLVSGVDRGRGLKDRRDRATIARAG